MRVCDGNLRARLPLWCPLAEEGRKVLVRHGTGAGKLSLALGVEKLSLRAQHGDGRDALLHGYAVFRREVEVLVVPAHVNLDYHKVLSDQTGQVRLVHLRIQRMTVRSPVGAEYQHDVPARL